MLGSSLRPFFTLTGNQLTEDLFTLLTDEDIRELTPIKATQIRLRMLRENLKKKQQKSDDIVSTIPLLPLLMYIIMLYFYQ